MKPTPGTQAIEQLGYFCEELENGEIQLTAPFVSAGDAVDAALARMNPGVRAAFEECWKHNEAGLRYLAGR